MRYVTLSPIHTPKPNKLNWQIHYFTASIHDLIISQFYIITYIIIVIVCVAIALLRQRIDSIWISDSVDKCKEERESEWKKNCCHQFYCWSTSRFALFLSFWIWLLNRSESHMSCHSILCVISFSLVLSVCIVSYCLVFARVEMIQHCSQLK